MQNLPTPLGYEQAMIVFGKIVVGALLGAVIGLEREAHGRPAGVRTHMLVVIGVVVFSEVSKAFVGSDPSRIAAQIVTGIGFLGAGSILRSGGEVRGLTTAASIWAASAVGMAVSVGGAFLLLAVLTTCLILVTLVVVSQLERRLYPRTHTREMLVVLRNRADAVSLIDSLTGIGIAIEGIRVVTTHPELELAISIKGLDPKALETATSHEGVLNARWS